MHLKLISDENVFFKWSLAELASDIIEMLVSEAISAWDQSENPWWTQEGLATSKRPQEGFYNTNDCGVPLANLGIESQIFSMIV